MSLTPQEVAEQEALEAAQKAGQGGTGASALGTATSGNLYIPAPPNTTVAYSGSDCNAFLVTYGARSRSSFTPLANLAAISYSVHRDKAPVRRLGEFVARDYTKGARTVAGTIVLINFDRAAFYELLHGKNIYGAYGDQIGMSDEIPPFDIMLMFSEENKGRHSVSFPSNVKDTEDRVAAFSKMWIRGVRLVDEGSVTGTDEAYMETSFQYVAEEVDYLKPSNEPETVTVAETITDFTNITTKTTTVEQAASPYRLFEYQTDPIVDYEAFVGDWNLIIHPAFQTELIGNFSYTLTKDDLGDRLKEPNKEIWKAKTATFSIDMSKQSSFLGNTNEISFSQQEGVTNPRVSLSGTGVHIDSDGKTFEIKYNGLPNGMATLEAEANGFRQFTLEDVYLSQADAWADTSVGEPGWLRRFFGAQATPKPAWGNKFQADIHNIGMDRVEEKDDQVVYDAITQPFGPAVGIINMPATEVFWDFTTTWEDTSGSDHFRAIISAADPDNGVERDCFEDYTTGSTAYRGNSLEVHLLETDILRDEIVQVSITLPRAPTVHHGTYSWEHADGYTDPVEKIITFSSDDQSLPFYEAWADPATYIEAAKDGSFSTLLEMTEANYTTGSPASAEMKVMVPPPPLVESVIKTTRPAPGYKKVTDYHNIETGSTIASQTIVLDAFSLGEYDLNSIDVNVTSDYYLPVKLDSISQDYDGQQTTIVLNGMDETRSANGSIKIGPSTDISTTTQDGYEFIAQEMYGDVAFIGEMANPDNFISSVDASTASFDFSTVPPEFQPTIPPIASNHPGEVAANLVNKVIRIASAREPRTFNESFNQAGIDSTLWGALTNGPYIKIADKPAGFTDGSVKFAQAGNEDKAWAAVSLTSLSPAGQQLLDNWGGTCNQSCLEANLKYFIEIKESSDGYYLQFDGWNFSFWNNHKWYSKLAEGKVIVPIGMYFCNADGTCGNIPADLQSKINSGEILPEFDESVASVNVLTNATYMGPIPFSIDYDTSNVSTLESLGVAVINNIHHALSGFEDSWGDVHNFTSSIDPIAAPYDMNASATVDLNPFDTAGVSLENQNVDLKLLHPGVETEVTWEYDSYSLGSKQVEITYTTIDNTDFETSMTINLGPTKPVDFDKCDPSSMTLTEVTSQGTIDICNNNIEDAQGNSMTVSDPVLSGANWEITISNIPALVLVPAGGITGFFVNAWDWFSGLSTAPTGKLEAVVYLKTVDLTTNATAGHVINGENIDNLSLKLRWDYPAKPGTTDTYVGTNQALQLEDSAADPNHFKWTHYYQQPPSSEVRLLLPQGEEGDNTEAFFSDNYSRVPNINLVIGEPIIKDVTNYDTVNSQPQLDFEIYNFPAQAEPLTFDLHYQYQLSKLDMNLLYLRATGDQYTDLNTEFDFAFTADVLPLGILDESGIWTGSAADEPGKFDVINNVWFVDHGPQDAGACSSPGIFGVPPSSAIDPVCYFEVKELVDWYQGDGVAKLKAGSNQFYYKSENDILFPTGHHPVNPTTFDSVIDPLGSYSVVVDYEQLSEYVPGNKYTSPGYIITTRLDLSTFKNYEFALDFDGKAINYKTDSSIGTQTDNSFCELLGGEWGIDPSFLDSLQGSVSVAGTCYDANGVEQPSYKNMAQCTAISGNKWTPDDVALGVCSNLKLDELIDEGKFTQFSFWFIGPNKDSNGFYEVHKPPNVTWPSYPNFQTCMTEMVSYYIDHFGSGNLAQHTSGTTP